MNININSYKIMSDTIINEIKKNQFRSFDTRDLLSSSRYIKIERFLLNIFGNRLSSVFIKSISMIFPNIFRSLIQLPKNDDVQIYARYMTYLLNREDIDAAEVAKIVALFSDRAIATGNGIGWGFIAPIDVNYTQKGRFDVAAKQPAIHSTIMILNLFVRLRSLGLGGNVDSILHAGANHVVMDYHRTIFSHDTEAIAYTTSDTTAIINVSVETAGLLSELGRIFDTEIYADIVRHMTNFTLSVQLPDGSWPYSDKMASVDVHHSCMVIKSLMQIMRQTHEDDDNVRIARAINRGVAHYLDHFFSASGHVIYVPSSKNWSAYAVPYAIDGLVAIALCETVDVEYRNRARAMLPSVIEEGMRAFDIRGNTHIIEKRSFFTSRMSAFRMGFAHFAATLADVSQKAEVLFPDVAIAQKDIGKP